MKPTETLFTDTQAVADSLAAIIKSERTAYSCYVGYLNLNTSDSNSVSEDNRMALVDWCYSIVDHWQFSRQTVASAIEMVDRFLSMPSNSVDAARVSDEALGDQTTLQLLTIAALYTAIKVNEKVVISSDLFANMCSEFYTAEEIEDMERTLLTGLSWRCHAPTAHQVGMSIFSLILPYVNLPEVTWGIVIDEMKYLTELAVRDYYFTTRRTSTVALAAVHNAIRVTSKEDEWCGEMLKSFLRFLRVIMECFDFDGMSEIAEARSRLRYLLLKEGTAAVDVDDNFLDADERSLDDSIITSKMSNRSSKKRELESNVILCQEVDEYSHVKRRELESNVILCQEVDEYSHVSITTDDGHMNRNELAHAVSQSHENQDLHCSLCSPHL